MSLAQTMSTVWQAAVIAAVVFALAVAGLTAFKTSQHRAPPLQEGRPVEAQALRTMQSERSPSDDKAATDSAMASNDGHSEGHKEDIDASIANYTLWLMVFTGVLAVATVFLAVATAGLWNYAAEQASDMKQSIAAAVQGAKAARDAVMHSDQAKSLSGDFMKDYRVF